MASITLLFMVVNYKYEKSKNNNISYIFKFELKREVNISNQKIKFLSLFF